MAQQVSEIKASARARSGTGGARATRREKRVPGIVYGDTGEPQTIALDANELSIIIGRGKFLSTLFELDVDGKKTRVIPREVQLDPVKDTPIHVDFQRVGPGARIRVNVPVRFINEALSPGLKRGGVLNIVRHEVEVTAPGRRHPGLLRVQSGGPRDRPLDPHLGHQAARGREAHHPEPRLHGRHRRRPQDRGGADAGCRSRCTVEGAAQRRRAAEGAAAAPGADPRRPPPVPRRLPGGRRQPAAGGEAGCRGQARREGQEVEPPAPWLS